MTTPLSKFFQKFAALAVVLAIFVGVAGVTGLTVTTTAHAQLQDKVPGGALGNKSDSEGWRFVREGGCGYASIPDEKAACFVNPSGETFRNVKNGPISVWGAFAIVVSVLAIFTFYFLRGKIMIGAGPHPQGETILRFNALERAVHWLTASSFIVLAITGLNIMYGRYVIMPIIGQEAFAWISEYMKIGHNYIAFAFMVGIAMMFVLWVRHNIPNMHDVRWLMVGGGLFSDKHHPAAPRFNAGQKLIFWSVVLGGLSLSLSGWALLFVGDFEPWAGTFAFLNNFGFNLPTQLSGWEEHQLSILWHTIVALVLIAIAIGHIYIGSLGMEGAIDAVGSGEVDLNWAKEHHSMWVEEELAKKGSAPSGGSTQPAE